MLMMLVAQLALSFSVADSHFLPQSFYVEDLLTTRLPLQDRGIVLFAEEQSAALSQTKRILTDGVSDDGEDVSGVEQQSGEDEDDTHVDFYL
jgi:hypothetical protein